ncbi:HK97 gp10 family phage protein [Salmonella enterica]|nr:HK97 gp10 family phage protein [Salmonella enterica]
MSKFTLDVKSFCEKAKKNPETVMRQVSIKLFRAIILGSPVDTGRFRNNWFAAIGPNHSMETTNYTGKEGTAAINRMTRVVGESRGMGWTELTLTNNLPYAQRLEFGWSKQAPVGMVRVNIARFNTLLNEEAAKVK